MYHKVKKNIHHKTKKSAEKALKIAYYKHWSRPRENRFSPFLRSKSNRDTKRGVSFEKTAYSTALNQGFLAKISTQPFKKSNALGFSGKIYTYDVTPSIRGCGISYLNPNKSSLYLGELFELKNSPAENKNAGFFILYFSSLNNENKRPQSIATLRSFCDQNR